MTESPWFLEYLGLDDKAARRDIKKSYARLLKTINQDEEIQKFERLREAYERSLEWVVNPPLDLPSHAESGPKLAEQTSSYPPQNLEIEEGDEGPEEENPNHLSQADFAALVHRWEREASALQRRDAEPDEILNFITHFFRDENLIHLQTREHFEFFIAQYITEITPSFRGKLLVQCANFFAWTQTPTYLHNTHAGDWVIETLRERDAWLLQKSHLINAQKTALSLYLRHAFTPKNTHQWRELERIHLSYPNWFGCWIHEPSFEDMNQKYNFDIETGYNHDLDDNSFYGSFNSDATFTLWIGLGGVLVMAIRALLSLLP